MSYFNHPVSVGQTSFPMKSEKPWIAYNPLQNNKSAFLLLDGPPYANGLLHMGHVRNRYLKDTLARAFSKSHNVQWRAGWDCHGLPVERNVEQLGVSREDPKTFLHAARVYATEQCNHQRSQLNTLGLMCDTNNGYKTMDHAQQAATLRVFSRMVEQGSVYSNYKPTSWCTECQSTVAAMEMEELDTASTDLYFTQELSDGTYALVWTTQAWSLRFHEALMVNPEATYVLYKWSHAGETRHLWMSKETPVPTWFKGSSDYVSQKQGKDFVGTSYRCRWTGNEHLVHAHAYVLADAGTGWLHASSVCSEEDYQALRDVGYPYGEQQGLDAAGMVEGMYFKKYHKSVCTFYQENESNWSHVADVRRKTHQCWRHKKELTVRPSLQWYVRVDNSTRERMLNNVDNVQFSPASSKNRLLDNLKNRPDWCVSRQRSWGVPLGLYHRDGKLAPFALYEMQKLANAVEEKGSTALYDLPLEKEGYTLCLDVLDVWFDSGCCFLTTESTTPEMVVEGHDQHRGWFQSSMLVSAVLNERLPYKHVVTHGFVTSKNKEKLSKSKGGYKNNTSMPAWEDVNPDVLRVWSTMGRVENDRVWDLESLNMATSMVGKWRNTVRFCLANSEDGPLDMNALTNAEHWMLHETTATVQKVLFALQHVDNENAFEAFHSLCLHTLSNHAFSMVKDRLYCGNPLEQNNVRRALHAVLHELGKVLSVVAPCLWQEALSYTSSMDTSETYEMNSSHYFAEALALRQMVHREWSALAQKGNTQHAHLELDRTNPLWNLKAEDLLQWAGVSEVFPSEKTLLSPSHGFKCPRCRFVYRHEEEDCSRCDDRSK